MVFFICCFTLAFLPAIPAYAADTYTFRDADGVGYEYSISSGNRAVITKVSAPFWVKKVTVPGVIPGTNYPIVAIGASSNNNYIGAFRSYSNYHGAFPSYSNYQVMSVTLPDSVCQIYGRAFEGLTNLQRLSVNGNDVVIEQDAFKGCNRLAVTFRGTGAIKHISGYVFGKTGRTGTNCLDFNVIKNRVDNDSWIGYDELWNNETEWEALVNSLTPFSVSVSEGDYDRDWTPVFDELTAAAGYKDPDQIKSASIFTENYNAWIRKAARWVDSSEEQAEIRLDVAYNILGGKGSNDMVFVMDASGSMYFGANLVSGSNYSRQFLVYDQVRSVSKALLDINDSEKNYNRVGAVMFGGSTLRGTSISLSETDNGMFTDYAKFIKWLDYENWIENQSTYYSVGLQGAVDILKGRDDPNRTPSVLFLSDGDPSTGSGRGWFPGGTISGYGGYETTLLSKLGTTRYSILFGNTSLMNNVTYIAGATGVSNDSSKAFASPDAETLKAAFQEILGAVADNLDLKLYDTAGSTFDVNGLPAVTDGTINLVGAQTTWDLSATNKREVYTIIILQDVKRNSDDYNAYYHGELETNLGNAILMEDADGTLLEVASTKLFKTLGTVTIHVHVTNGYATSLDGSHDINIEDTITETGTYTARYTGHKSAKLESLSISDDGGIIKTELNTESFPESYIIKDVRKNYDVYVAYTLPPVTTDKTWSVYATVVKGTISMEEELDIPVNEKRVISYSPDYGYRLKSIIIDNEREVDPVIYANAYQFYETIGGTEHYILVIYELIPTIEGESVEWGDYRY